MVGKGKPNYAGAPRASYAGGDVAKSHGRPFQAIAAATARFGEVKCTFYFSILDCIAGIGKLGFCPCPPTTEKLSREIEDVVR
jgi:hypothetical protein